MGIVFLKCAIGLLIPSVLLMLYIMAARGVGLQGIWKLAMEGHRLSRVYVAISCLAFAFAVIAEIFLLMGGR